MFIMADETENKILEKVIEISNILLDKNKSSKENHAEINKKLDLILTELKRIP